MSSWRGEARLARGKGGISNGWGQGKEGGRESGDKWRLDPTRLRNSTQHADRRTEVGSEERRTQRKRVRANLAAAVEVIMRRNEL